MNSYIVHVSDPAGFDEEAVILAKSTAHLGEAVGAAIDELMEKNNGKLSFPLFIDVHPSTNFSPSAWMYGKDRPAVVAGMN